MSVVTLTLRFGREGNAESYLGNGWSAGEPNYRWMTGEMSEVWLEHPGHDLDYTLEMDLHPFVRPPELQCQRLVVQVRGIEIGTERIEARGTFRWSIPKTLLAAAGPVRLTFLHPDARQPKELGISGDDRTLAVSTYVLRLLQRPVEEPPNTDDLLPDGPAASSTRRDDATLRSTVFVGNCQMLMLANLYRLLCPEAKRERVAYVASYQEANAGERNLIGDADVLVQQVLDFAPAIGELPTRAKVQLVPHVTGAFLWPYSGQAHPNNRPEPTLDQSGPYSPELGDSFLNRRIIEGVDADSAVNEYLETDVSKVKRADRLLEIFLDKQRKRDLTCGFEFTDFIDTNFRTTSLFRSPNHLNGDLTVKFVTDVLHRLGVERADIDRVLATGQDRLFPRTETPIHAKIAAHFGLTYAPPGRRYRFFDEGGFTFAEYAARYMCYTWNSELAEGLHLIRMRQFEEGAAKLEAAIPTAPRSAYGRMVLADVLEKLTRLDDAAKYAAEAVQIDPMNDRYVERLTEISTHRFTLLSTQRRLRAG